MTAFFPEDLAELFESGVSIMVGTRNASLLPEPTRGVGAIVHPDRQRLTIFLPAEMSSRTIANLRENQQIAIGFSSILDHRSLQVKGEVDEIRDATEAEREVILRYHAAFAEILYFTGIPKCLTRQLNVWPAIAISFTARDIFLQTPGPKAGELMSSAVREPTSALNDTASPLNAPKSTASVTLRDIPARAFQGVTPAMIATCDAKGIPNITYLSQIYSVDAAHVALSCQFFNKTKKNVLENRLATSQVYDPLTFDAFQLVIKYNRAETDGKLFEMMSRRIDAIASHVGMAGVFKLLSADVYEVDSVERLSAFLRPNPNGAIVDAPDVAYKSEMTGLQTVSQRVSKAKDLDELYSATLEALHDALGFENSMILLPDEAAAGGETTAAAGRGRLYAIAGRGYGDSDSAGVGAEVGFGDGLIGTVARERCVLRVAGVGAELRYGRAIRTSVQRATGSRGLQPEIPLPGLVDAQSQMAIPLVANDRLVGVIAVESKKPAAFHEWHEAFLDIVAHQIASAIENMTLRSEADLENVAAVSAPAPVATDATPVAESATLEARAPVSAKSSSLKLRFFKSDDCVFADDEYLVRNVPGRILWKIVREYTERGRTEFTNRELRLDAALGLPAFRDNLESRLVLLRKRLDQKCAQLRIVPIARGRFRLDVTASLVLEESA